MWNGDLYAMVAVTLVSAIVLVVAVLLTTGGMK